MRAAKIMYKDEEAGILTQHDDASFTFSYHQKWIDDPTKPSISLTLPKNQRAFYSPYLFPVFFHLLPEGNNLDVVCFYNRLDKNDYFGILITAIRYDSIGAINAIKIENP
jgi:serine/threonine-protein kinase HipA